jgi:hypothetical protein
MDSKRASIRHSKPAALCCALAAALLLMQATAFAQPQRSDANGAEAPGFLAVLTQWFDRQAENIDSTFKNAGKGFANFGHEADIAARSTVDNATNAADAVARLPGARVVSGHAKCRIAPNGAPDCVTAANHVCRASGFRFGKSLDMTTAEICSAKVYLAGRNSGPGCHTETFVSRALCQ